MEVPFHMLKPETLTEVIKDFLLKKGSDFGHEGVNLQYRIEQIKSLVEQKKIKIIFDDKTQSCRLVDTTVDSTKLFTH